MTNLLGQIEKSDRLALGYCKPGLEATESPAAQDIILSAGWFEGEGWCGPGSGASAQITQADLWLPNRLHALFGGSVSVVPPKGVGKSSLNKWSVSGARARGFLMTIYKFLSPRRKQQVRKALGREE